MSDALWIAILSSSVWGVINALVAGWMVRSRTKTETGKIASETRNFESEAEERIYRKLQDQLSAALNRAANAENRANEAIDEAHTQGNRVLMLIKMFEQHIPWDRAILELLQKLGVPAENIPAVPELNPYLVLADATSRSNGQKRKRTSSREPVEDTLSE